VLLGHLYQIQRKVKGTQEVEQLFPVGIFAYRRDQLRWEAQLVEVKGYIHGSTTGHSAGGKAIPKHFSKENNSIRHD
jgi:hypothetical protein